MVTTIGNSAFMNCSGLTTVNLPVATTIGDNMLSWCLALENLTLGAVPPSVATNAFANCPPSNLIIAGGNTPVAASNGSTVGMFIDFSVFKTIDLTTEKLGELPSLIEVLIPLEASLQGKTDYVIYRYHGSAVNVITTSQRYNRCCGSKQPVSPFPSLERGSWGKQRHPLRGPVSGGGGAIVKVIDSPSTEPSDQGPDVHYLGIFR